MSLFSKRQLFKFNHISMLNGLQKTRIQEKTA